MSYLNKLFPIVLALLCFGCGDNCDCEKYSEKIYNIYRSNPIDWEKYPQRSKKTVEKARKVAQKQADCMNRCYPQYKYKTNE